MEPISKTVGALKKFKVRDADIKQAIVLGIKKELGEEISTKNISIRAGVAYLNCDNTLKSEIFLRKLSLLPAINAQLKHPLNDLR